MWRIPTPHPLVHYRHPLHIIYYGAVTMDTIRRTTHYIKLILTCAIIFTLYGQLYRPFPIEWRGEQSIFFDEDL